MPRMGAQVGGPPWERAKSPKARSALFNIFCCQSDSAACSPCEGDALDEDTVPPFFGGPVDMPGVVRVLDKYMKVSEKSLEDDNLATWPKLFGTQMSDQHEHFAEWPVASRKQFREHERLTEWQLNSLPTPQRVNPTHRVKATPQNAKDAEVDTFVSLANLPPPPRTAPSAKASARHAEPIRRVLHVKIGNRWKHLSFLDGDNLQRASADFISFLRRDGLEVAQIEDAMVKRMRNMNLFGLQDDSVNANDL